MRNSPKYLTCSTALVLALLLTLNQSLYALDLPTLAAAQVAAQPAPPPSQIASAQKVFLTNAGEDPNFPIDSTASFNDIYASLQAWGHYQLVDSPDKADLVFQLHGVAPITSVGGTDGNVYSSTSPAFQLTILNPQTNVTLWTITSPVNLAGRGKTRARWVTIAESNLISRIKILAHQPLSASETANLTTVPKSHGSAVALILVGATIGLGVGAAFLIHHEYEKSLADMKASQDAFCNANHIPLSQCAGG